MQKPAASAQGLRKRPHVLIAGAGIGGLDRRPLSLLDKSFDCDV